MTTPPIMSVTDELIAELEAAADYAANQVIRSHGWEGTVDEFADGMLGADERYMRWAEPATILALLSERAELKRKVGGLNASRIAYASEFPLNSDGEPDTGSIHANIRKLKRDAERYRWLRDNDPFYGPSQRAEIAHAAQHYTGSQFDSEIDAAMTP